MGIAENLICYMPMQSNLSFLKGVEPATFTRATTATYISKSTELVTEAAIDEPRFEADGVLTEGASTNLILRSEEFDAGVWNLQFGALVTANQSTAPDGSLTADLLDTSVGGSFINQGIVFNAVPQTYSIWLKSVSGSGTYTLNWFDGASNRFLVNLTETWQRFSVTFTPTAGAGFIYPGDSRIVGGSDLDTCYAWGAQLEEEPIATSSIPTLGSTVTRAADRLDIPAANWVALNADYSVGIDVQVDNTTDEILAVSFAGVTGDTDLGADSSNQARFRHNGVATAGSALGTTTKRLLATWANGGVQNVYIDGVLDAGPTATTLAAGALTAIHLGSNSAGGNPLNGHLAELRIYDKELTAEEAVEDFIFGAPILTTPYSMIQPMIGSMIRSFVN